MMFSRLSLLLMCLTAMLFVHGQPSPPPIFEHKMEKDFSSTRCEACQAIVKQVIRKIPLGDKPDLSTPKLRRARETRVSEVIDKICDPALFARYEFAPPTMADACNHVAAEIGEDLENIFYKGELTDVEIRTKVCLKGGWCKRLWTPKEEEDKRDRSPEEIEAETQRAKKDRKEEEEKERKAKAAKRAEERRKKRAEASGESQEKKDEPVLTLASPDDVAPAKQEL